MYNNKKKVNKNKRNKQNNRRMNGVLRTPYRQDYPNDVISYGDITPTSQTSKMNFTSEVMQFTAASPFLVRRYRPNSLFDPDVSLGGTTYAGFAAKAALYREYLALWCEALWHVANNEDFGVYVGICFTNQDLGPVVGSVQQARDALENGMSTGPRLLAAKGGIDTHMLRLKADLARVLGNVFEYLYSGAYSSLNNTNPAALLFVNFIVYSSTGANLTNGVTGAPTLRTTTKWYNRQTNFD